MQDALNNATSNEYRSVPISILVESATNPRKRFDEKNLEELAAYVPGHISRLLCRCRFCDPSTPNGAWKLAAPAVRGT